MLVITDMSHLFNVKEPPTQLHILALEEQMANVFIKSLANRA